jgi:hypothetical protein
LLWTSCNDHSDDNFIVTFIDVLLLKIAVSATCNGLYDAALEQAMTCACVQVWKRQKERVKWLAGGVYRLLD